MVDIYFKCKQADIVCLSQMLSHISGVDELSLYRPTKWRSTEHWFYWFCSLRWHWSRRERNGIPALALERRGRSKDTMPTPILCHSWNPIHLQTWLFSRMAAYPRVSSVWSTEGLLWTCPATCAQSVGLRSETSKLVGNTEMYILTWNARYVLVEVAIYCTHIWLKNFQSID
jgi:hypothetical protein